MGARDETLAAVYATALLDLAFEKGVHAEVLSELRQFGAILEEDERFRDFLNAPSISPEAKKGVVERVFGGSLSDHSLNFLKVVLEKRRQDLLPRVIVALVAGYHERMGELVVKVQSAVSLEEGQRSRLQDALKERFKKDIILEERVRPKLLGGLVLRVGDRRIDGSLRSRLETIGSRLAAARLYSGDYYED